MNWEAQAYSFGSPHTQTPTPHRIPASAIFPRDTPHTPQGHDDAFDYHTGWTPAFLDNYNAFDATPDRPSTARTAFDASFPDLASFSSQKQPYMSREDLQAGASPAASGKYTPSLGLQSPVQLKPSSASRRSGLDGRDIKTPTKAARRLQDPFTGQTATPPQSASKQSKRKVGRPARKVSSDDEQYPQPANMDHGNFDFMSSASSLSYPMPTSTAEPSYLDKSFWDPCAGLDMPIDLTSDVPFYPTPGDWTQSAQLDGSQPARQYRQSLSNPQANSAQRPPTGFDFMPPLPEDQFGAPLNQAVNPGVLYNSPQATLPAHMGHTNYAHTTQSLRSSTGPPSHEPYQQQRESSRLRRPRSMREIKSEIPYDRLRVGSPTKSTRPGNRRALSDTGFMEPSALQPTRLHEPQRPATTVAGKSAYGSPRKSPVKQASQSTLTSIPEAAASFNPRTAVTFSIDANGRARTETTVVMEEHKPPRRTRSLASSDCWDSPRSGSSTDEDPIMILNSDNPFDMPRILGKPKMPPFAMPRQRQVRSRKSSSPTKSSSSRRDPGSDTETDIDDSGDAASALRKVMESRPRRQPQPSPTPTRQTLGREMQSGRQLNIGQLPPYNPSPTPMLDPQMRTPSKRHSVRCTCNRRDGNEFMIQCEACNNWLHCGCVAVDPQCLPLLYICLFCVQTPSVRRGRGRNVGRGASSPLAHKSFQTC